MINIEEVMKKLTVSVLNKGKATILKSGLITNRETTRKTVLNAKTDPKIRNISCVLE